MFNINLRRLYYTCDKVILRNLRNRRLEPSPNPGLQKRLNVFRKEGIKVQDDDAHEFVEHSESDFHKAGALYNEHLNEKRMGKHEMRHHIVKEKYFKENMPNLLTWSEKEQIRHLATMYPDEWTLEKIAESFPITVQAAKKLLKFNWKPASEQRIARHDASAMRNWRELKEGTLDIPHELQQHFLKFSERVIPPLNRESIKIDITEQENLGEFERIIQRCAREDKSKETNNDNAFNNESAQENNVKVAKKDFKRVTLDELTARIKNRLEKGTDVDIPDKLMFNAVSNNDTESSTQHLTSEIELLHDVEPEKELSEYKEKDEEAITVPDYPQRIRIPKKNYKKGATYKVNDCYYDHDGKFLYRVLGMSN